MDKTLELIRLAYEERKKKRLLSGSPIETFIGLPFLKHNQYENVYVLTMVDQLILQRKL